MNIIVHYFNYPQIHKTTEQRNSKKKTIYFRKLISMTFPLIMPENKMNQRI
jgi:hypothetical protein